MPLLHGISQSACEVWRASYLEPLVDQLMRPCDQLETIDMIKLAGHFIPKQPPSPSRTNRPSPHIFWVTPDQIAEGTLMWYLLCSCNDSYLIQGPYLRRKATMYTEDLPIDDRAEDEEIEDLTARFPDGGVTVFGLTFFVETVDLGYLTGFMVAPDEGDAFWVSVFGQHESVVAEQGNMKKEGNPTLLSNIGVV